MVTTSTTTSFSLPLGSDSRWALFIDLDGTWLDVCAKPERVVATYDVITLLPAPEQWVASPRECRRLLAELVGLGELGLVG